MGEWAAVAFLIFVFGTFEYHKWAMRKGGGIKYFIIWLIAFLLIMSLLLG